MLQVDVVLFERRRHVASIPRAAAPEVAGKRGYEPLDGSWDASSVPTQEAWEALPAPRPPRPWFPTVPGDAPMVTQSLAHTAVADRWVAHSSAGVDERRPDHTFVGYMHQCKLTRSAADAAAAGMVCLPPGVASIVARPQAILPSDLGNPGHLVWDDFIPFFSCLVDLGLLGREGDFQLLLRGNDEWLMKDASGFKANWKLARQMMAGIAPRFTPISAFTLQQQIAAGELVLFRTVQVGIGGRGTSSMLPNYSSMRAEQNLVWYVRGVYLRNLGLAEDDHDWSATVAGKSPVAPRSINVLFLQKVDKRAIINIDSLTKEIMDAFPEVKVTIASWEELKAGAAGEARLLMNTHICISVDGTGANNLLFLPPGAVHISLGVVRPWGTGHIAGVFRCSPTASGNPFFKSYARALFIADFIFSGVRHIRVLYYDGLRFPEDLDMKGRKLDGLVSMYPFSVPFEAFQPFMRKALDLVTEGFPIPVPFLENHSPLGRAAVRVFNAYPEVARIGSYLYMGSLSGDALIMDHRELWRGVTWWHAKGSPPSGLLDVIMGKGTPPGPDINSVSGKALQDVIKDHPRWSQLVNATMKAPVCAFWQDTATHDF